jgi:hypothetical protein
MNKQDVTHYLRYGLWAAKAVAPPTAGRAVKTAIKAAINPDAGQLPTSEPSNPAKKTADDTEKLPEPSNFEQVVEEINGDLAALKDYLKNSVFYAAGFVTYCNQELERIRNRFKEMEDNDRQWIGLIRTAVKYEKNTNIPYNIAHSKRDFRMRREIALELKEVRESYTQVH